MQQNIGQAMEIRMQKCIEAFKHELSRMRTGRAHPSFLEHIRIDYYGNATPLSQVASITVADARTLVVSPWEKNLIAIIEKAIISADLGLNPATSGEVIRVPLPVLTEERRKDLIKSSRHEAETARVALRNLRRDTNAALKDQLKNKEITEDEERRALESVQKLTDKYTAEVDQLLSAKEKELMVI